MKTTRAKHKPWHGTHRAFLQTTGGTVLASVLSVGVHRRCGAAMATGAVAQSGPARRQVTGGPGGVPADHRNGRTQLASVHGSVGLRTDSNRLLLHRSAGAHGGNKNDPRHQYLRCDIDDGCSLHPLTEEQGVTAASVAPDGRYVYYFVNETRVGGGRLTLKRVNLDGTDRQTVLVVDSPLPETRFRPSGIYPLSTISSDGRRVALSAFLGDGQTENAPFGLMVFDVEQAAVRLILQGPSWCNMHPQYCRSTDPEAAHDILVQENHGNVATPTGAITQLVGGAGANIHVIRDDGSNFRDMPWGRDGNEQCQGHQCWRGRTTWAITSTGCRQPPEAQLIEGQAVPHAGHVGIGTPGAVRDDLVARFPNRTFYHFATDVEGQRLVSDAGLLNKLATIYLAEIGAAGRSRSVSSRTCSVRGRPAKRMHTFTRSFPPMANSPFSIPTSRAVCRPT